MELMFLKELILIRQANQKSDICHYWHFFNKRFKFQSYVCNRCHDLLMMSTSLSDIAIFKIKNSDIVVLLVELVKVKL